MKFHGKVVNLGRDSDGNDKFVRVSDDGYLLSKLMAYDSVSSLDDIQVACDDQGRLLSSGTLTAAVDDVETKLDTIIGNIDGLETLLTTINGNVDGVEADLTTIIGHIDGIEGVLVTIDADTSSIVTDISNIKTDTTAIIGHIDGIESSLTTIAGHIDGLEQYILDTQLHYKITDIDDGNATYDYFGFVDKAGNYYIMRQDKTGGDSAFRYTAGSSGYTTAWTNRASESYDYFYTTF